MATGGFKPLRWLTVIVILPALALAGYTWFVLTWSFSAGERAGYVQKLSRKGWLCKTWEGEMALVSMPGTVAEKFPFTVRSDEGRSPTPQMGPYRRPASGGLRGRPRP